MEQLIRLLERHLSGKKVLGLFLLTNSVYLFMLAFTIPTTMAFSKGMKLLDIMPMGYDLNYVKELFSSLGEKGRETYLTTQLPLDMVYPLLFGLSYSLLIAYFLNKLNKLNAPYVFLCILPILGGVADYVENLGIMIMLNSYPDLTWGLVRITALFSIIKSSSSSLFFIALLLVLIAFGFKTIKGEKTCATKV
jgi:hypothetical protein